MPSDSSPRPDWTKIGTIVAVLTLILGVVSLIVTHRDSVASHASGQQRTSSPVQSAPAIASESTTSAAPRPPVHDTSAPAPPSSSAPAEPLYLLDAATGDGTSSSGPGGFAVHDDSTVHGQVQPSSIEEELGCQADGDTYYISFTIAPKYHYLDGTVALADGRSATYPVTWRVDTNGRVRKTGTASQHGPITKLHIAIAGTYQVKLVLQDTHAQSVDCGFAQVQHLIWGALRVS